MTRRLAALALVLGCLFVAAPAHADTGLAGYAVTVSANAFQLTEDYPQAAAHPLVEADAAYSFASLDASRAHALSSILWPGGLGAHVGTLLTVLGGPTINALNYPVKAEAPSSTGAPEETLTTASAVMFASSKSAGLNQQTAEASTTATSLNVGLLSFGTPTSHSVANLDSGTGKLTATGTSSVASVNLADMLTIGSISTSVSATSLNGAKPVFTATTDYHDMKIAGQAAYVDATGIHLGSPGKPSGSGPLDIVNTAVKALGMNIYFSTAKQVTLGGVSYFYPASILIVWTPPGDSNHDTITIALGSAAATMIVSSTPGAPTPTATTGTTGSDTGNATLSPTPSTSALQFPSTSSGIPNASATPPLLAGPVTPSSSGQPVLPPATQLAVATPRGLGVGWILLLAIAGLLGAIALPRVPALLRAATPPCDREQPWPVNDPDRRS